MSSLANLTGPESALMSGPVSYSTMLLLRYWSSSEKPLKKTTTGPPARYIRQGTGVVLLAYDLDNAIRYTQTRQQRTKADYAQFMDHIISTYYIDFEYIDLVQDNLNTHKYGSFYEHLPLNQARVLTRKLVFHYTPKHGSWLNVAEIEFSALARQCLNRRIGSLEELTRQVEVWTTERNERAVQVHWNFTVAIAKEKLKRWYQQVNPVNKPVCCKD